MNAVFETSATCLRFSLERFERAGLKITGRYPSTNPAGDLVALIREQRTFQANLATVRTTDELMKDTLDLLV
ncbi:MAG: flagellar basal body rod C-terminal domain-containing protein [Candidatus Neomarinimicrobiota bacterium]